MLPRGGAKREQPLLVALELLRLEGGGGESLLDGGTGSVGLGKNALKGLGDRRQNLLARSGLALDAPERRGEPGTARALALQRVERFVELAGDLLALHHQLAASGERFLLPALWARG